ncbi:hypothetical protein [Pseudoalteromonas ardens]|uniref:hypothetical protein n=1 Tax=Pseudoalteromonas ardens TaxID=3048490 RepID=UPI000B21841D|nr:hypothetical protein [Pseudoalteromonas sp. R96]
MKLKLTKKPLKLLKPNLVVFDGNKTRLVAGGGLPGITEGSNCAKITYNSQCCN